MNTCSIELEGCDVEKYYRKWKEPQRQQLKYKHAEGQATLYLVHKTANLPPAGRASDTVKGGMRI